MSSGAAGDAFLRGIFDGCIPAGDLNIQRRPYHKNCKCALHDKSRDHCTRHSLCNKVSYPIRRSWSEGSLAVMAAANSTPHSGRSSPCSPAGITRTQSQLSLCLEEDEDLDMVKSKV